MMTIEEMYEFDLNGYIVYPNILAQEEVEKINTIIDNAGVGAKRKFSFFHIDPYFMELMAHPRILGVLKVMLGDWLRFDHAFGMEMGKTSPIPEDLHAGPLKEQRAFFYQWSNGHMRNGLIKVIYALNDVNPGDGGFICVPGSHKGNVNYMPRPDYHLVVNPTLKAGDVLIFTEALVHGSRPWKAEQRRRVLIYSYAPGCLAWMDDEWCEPYRMLAANDIQKSLLRSPHVNEYIENPDLSIGRWPRNQTRPAVQFPRDEYMRATEAKHTLKNIKHSVRQVVNGVRNLGQLLRG
ncbi:MAG TPA: hypothetical protein DCL61_27610 [Cyanobacteria bacterium UBA12227]|nr:hypothetical protein [Cyanobacteria bacterium UBA12227]HAX84831.1 hypothetical protein [Cyanobacteria bacterium UBA11370]